MIGKGKLKNLLSGSDDSTDAFFAGATFAGGAYLTTSQLMVKNYYL